jgi:type I restriction enzyme R subunit
VGAGHAEDTPDVLKNSPALRALYNNLKGDGGAPAPVDGIGDGTEEETGGFVVIADRALRLAQQSEETVKKTRPDAWRGVQAREQVIKAALYGVLQDVAEVERIFLIIKAQGEY